MGGTDAQPRPEGRTSLATLARFYLSCIEAEQAAALALPLGGNYVEAGAGFMEAGTGVPIADDPDVATWCAKRSRDDPDGTVALGWPVCVGRDRQSRRLSAAPLLIGDARVVRADGDAWRCERAGGGVDLNAAALTLLGFSAEDRLAMETAVAQSVAVEEADGRQERTSAILRELREHGVDGLADIGAEPPHGIGERERDGIVNAAVLLPPASGTTLTLNLTRDLQGLASNGGEWGAASVVFGGDPVGGREETVDPPPAIAHSSAQQDRAVHSAMTQPLTVVTGPPGSGKSQVVLNAVASAFWRGETVLIASKNNKAVDVVVERLRTTAPLCPVVRAGAASQRQDLATDINRLAGEAERAEPVQGLVDATDRWRSVHRQVRGVHEGRERRLSLLAEMQALESRLTGSLLPDDVPEGITVAAVDAAAEQVRAALLPLKNPEPFRTLRELHQRARSIGPPPEALPEGADPASIRNAVASVRAALRELARWPGVFARRARREERWAAVSGALERFGKLVPHLHQPAHASVADVDPALPEAGAAGAYDRFSPVAEEAVHAAEQADAQHRMARARGNMQRRMRAVREASAEFGKCAPHLAERAAAALAAIKPLASDPGIGTALTSMETLLDEARNHATAVAERGRRAILGKRLAELPDMHDTEDALAALADARVKAGLALFRARTRQMQTDRTEAWQAAGHLASRIAAAAKGNARVADVHALVPDALPALPVWAVTNLSTRGTLPLTPGLFDLVIIDEASQCDAASAMPLLARAKRAMVIGDEHQLPHITSLGELREEVIAKRHGLDSASLAAFGYRANSCFALARARLRHPPLMLDLHFRSHPAVVEFSNRQFYAGRMTMCGTSRPPEGLSALEWVSVSGRCERGSSNSSWRNVGEATAVAARIATDLASYRPGNLSVGVVTPFAAQAKAIIAALGREGVSAETEGIEVATAHRFQGGERDVIYLSPVVDERSTRQVAAFAADPNLLNVALTRARCRLVIVGSDAASRNHPNQLRALAEHVAALAATGFDSPLERDLHAALREQGVEAEPGVEVGRYRLDMAVRQGDTAVDIECDGAPFHRDDERDAERDRALREMGWAVVRFSGRRIMHRLDECVDEVLRLLGGAGP